MDVLQRNKRFMEFAKFVSVLVVWSDQKIHIHLPVTISSLRIRNKLKLLFKVSAVPMVYLLSSFGCLPPWTCSSKKAEGSGFPTAWPKKQRKNI